MLINLNQYLSTAPQTPFQRPFGNLGIGISALALALESTLALRKIYFCLTKCFMKNKTFM